jgi:phosphoribosyl 1,2-cyclic phosphate phosphodiesterase
MKQAIPCYGMKETLDVLRRMFAYAFEDQPEYPSHKPQLDLHAIESGGPVRLIGLDVWPIPLWHGPTKVLGFRFGRFAYCTDCNRIPESSMELLVDLDVLVLDGLRHTPHPTHFHLDAAIEMACRIGAEKTYFTHIAHEMGHAETNRTLPQGMALAHDGLTFDVCDQ